MSVSVDCIVVGAGVVGLAVARQLAVQGRETLVLEADSAYGSGISSRNSEVIHAGIYYPRGSLKASLCVEGKRLLYAYCDERAVPHRRCGKLIVGSGERDRASLEAIERAAMANNVTDVRWLSQQEVLAMEPELACEFALYSPSTGIVDSHALMTALVADLDALGGHLLTQAPVTGGSVGKDGITLVVGGVHDTRVVARTVVNCAGLGAQGVARALDGLPPSSVPPLHFAKGNYYVLRGKSPFQRLVYPAPEVAGLGTHLTLDLAGRARFGPDVEWVDAPDYSVDPDRADRFYAAIRSYWPGLPDGALAPGYAGIRPKLQAPGEAAADFMIQGPVDHGVPGLVNLFGIESPGLTSSLAIARYVATLI